MDWGLSEWMLAALAALLIGMAKAGFGGVAVVSILIMASILPAKQSTGTVLPLLIIADICAVWTFNRFAQWQYIHRLFIPAGIGVIIGFFIMEPIPEGAFQKVIGWIVMIMVGLHFLQRRYPRMTQTQRHPATIWIIGILCGITTMLANAAGAIMTLYLLGFQLQKMSFVGTAAWFFFLVNLFKVPFSYQLGLMDAGSLTMNLWLAPLVVAGVITGKWLLGYVSQRLFENLMLWFAIAAAIRLVFF